MARHATRKNGTDGRARTLARKARRVAKYGSPALDIERSLAAISTGSVMAR